MSFEKSSGHGHSPCLTIATTTAADYPDILALRLPPEQQAFIASNEESLAEAEENSACVPLTLRVDGRCVGFALYALDPDDNNYWIYRLMIGAPDQGKGYGAAALHALVARLSALPGCRCIMLGVYPENQRALALYHRYGFRPTGEKFGKEILLRYPVDAPCARLSDVEDRQGEGRQGVSASRDALYHDPHLAALYDVFQPRAERSDFDFYLPLIAQHRRVLDIGCGTGALLREARQRGHGGRLTGIDPAAPMIALARRDDRIEWICDYLTPDRFSDCFDLALMTGHVFQTLIDDEQIRNCLRAVARALRPGGLLAFDTRNSAARAWETWGHGEPERIILPSGQDVLVTTQIEQPFDGQTLCFSEYFEGPMSGLPRLSRSRLRFVGRTRLFAQLMEAGFVIEADYGDFDQTAFTPSSPEILILARSGG